MSHFVWKLRRVLSFMVIGHNFKGCLCLIFFPLYLLVFGSVCFELLNLSVCVCVCVCILCVSARQERTCPHMVGLDTAISWRVSVQIRDWLQNAPVFHHRKKSLPALNEVTWTNQRHFRQRVHHTMCVLFIHSQARLFIIFCWMAGKNKSPQRNWPSPTFTLNRRLSTLVH